MNWQGNWIWLEEALKDNHSTVLVRREFDCAKAPKLAAIAVSASHIYRLRVNGTFVGRGPDRADPRFPYFDAYDISRLLRPGRNVVSCLAYHLNAKSANRAWCLYDGPPGFLAQLDLDGQIIATDRGWRIRRAPGWLPHSETITRFMGFRHLVDLGAAEEEEKAAALDYDDSSWSAPVVKPFAPEGPLPQPIPREIPFLVPTPHDPILIGGTHPQYPSVENLRYPGHPDHPTTVKPTAEGAWITMDFGRPMGGFPEFDFEPQGAGQVDVYYAEGTYWTLADRLTLPGRRCHYQPLDWRGGRYVALQFRNLAAPVVVRSIKFVEMVYPFETRGQFKSSDLTLNRTWGICRQTAWAAVKDHPVDCLTREQALWISDIGIHNRSMAACFGDLRPTVKAVRQAFRVMQDDGVVPVPGPAALGYQRTAENLPWSEQPLNLALILRDTFWHTGDKEILQFSLPYLERLYAHFARYEDARGLLCSKRPGLPSLTLFGGWNPFLKEGVTTAFNAEYVLSLAAAAELAQIMGRDELARVWSEKARRVSARCRELFWNPKRRLYLDGERDGKLLEQYSPTPNAWAAMAGLVDKADAGAWAESLRNDPMVMSPISPHDATHLLEAYAALDLELHLRDLLETHWGGIVRNNEPTVPEFWQTGEANGLRYREDFSRCHPYGSGPAYVLMQYVLGARPAAPGWAKASIRPHSMGLAFASGRVPTPLGDLGISWERGDTSWDMEIELPKGMQAELCFARLAWAGERLLVDGQIVRQTDHWTEYTDQAHRRYASAGPREMRCTISSPGRHTVRLESY